MRFPERYFSLFHQILTFSETESWDSLTSRLDGLLEEEENKDLPDGFSDSDRADALAPVLMWIDERLLTSGRADALEWNSRSLQRRLMDTNQGGEIFYRRLKALLAKRLDLIEPVAAGRSPEALAGTPLTKLWLTPGRGPEPLESVVDVYALCLVLGYRGRFYAEQPKGFQRLRDLAIEQIAAWREKVPAPIRRAVKERRWLQWVGDLIRDYAWVVFHLALPIVVCVYLWILSSQIVNDLPF
jgi:type VI protein secretion system component VasF